MAVHILLARGARHAEDLVLERLETLLPRTPEPRLLARPVRLVVPSSSLRHHLAATLLARRGRAVAGLVIQTHRGLAHEALARLGEAVRPADALLPLLGRRLARRQPPLERVLGELEDGYHAAAASLRDFLDAGLEPLHAEALDELLAADGGAAASPAGVRRARALVATARQLYELTEHQDLDHAARLLRRARDAIAARPQEALPTRALLIHGYADATAVAGDLLETLLRAYDGTAVIDQPPDPRRPGRRERAFSTPLVLRFGQLAAAEEAAAAADEPAIELLIAADPQREARAVARR
ncbi:MAG: hypothetical protein D6696_11195, partial [Acidobacteria bacterium]